MLFLKKFLRLRRIEGKARKPGYYWVQWCYGFNNKPEWVIARYIDFGNWSIDGRERMYRDTDFIAIDENRIPRYPWPKYLYFMTAIAECLLIAFFLECLLYIIAYIKDITS